MLRAAGLTDPGQRAYNQDRFAIDLARGVFALADGMGGEQCGELAAELAITGIFDYIQRFEQEPFWPFGKDPSLGTSGALAANAIQFANRSVWDQAQRQRDCAGMGSTIVAVFVSGDTAAIASAGDSRVYLLRAGRLEPRTRDDLLVSTLVSSGRMGREEARTHPMKHVLTRAAGVRANLEVQIDEIRLHPGDRLILCSDGLHGPVDDEAIQSIFQTEDDLTLAVHAAIEAARERGGTDNISCVGVEYAEYS